MWDFSEIEKIRENKSNKINLIIMQKKYITIASFALVALFATGCRSTKDYQKFAETGKNYSIAVDELLKTSGEIIIQASSEQILEEDRLKFQNLNTSITNSRYKQVSAGDERRLQVLRDIREHNSLLRNYFEKFFLLADSKSPESAKNEIEGIIENLNKISKRIRRSDFIQNLAVSSDDGKFLVSSRIRGALRDELNKRKKTIIEELELQEELLKELSDSIEKETAIIRRLQEKRLIIQPLTKLKLISDENKWIKNRIRIMNMQRNSDELKNASKKLREFKIVFKDFAQGKLSIKRLNQFIRDIDSFIAIIDKN